MADYDYYHYYNDDIYKERREVKKVRWIEMDELDKFGKKNNVISKSKRLNFNFFKFLRGRFILSKENKPKKHIFRCGHCHRENLIVMRSSKPRKRRI